MNRLTTADRTAILRCLVEGCSVRSTCRMTGFAKATVLKLLADMGDVCEDFHDRTVRGLRCDRIQCDEIWSFCGSKAKNVPEKKQGDENYGDVWTWVGLDKDTKLVVSWYVGDRDSECANRFMGDLAGRLTNRVQLTTDGHRVYLQAVYGAFGTDVDYAMLVKIYGNPNPDTRYSPCECLGAKKDRIIGNPISEDITTSHIERQNLTMRMGMRRYTRLTNAFSKKLANHRAALAIHYVYYNFCRVHQTTRVTPAMEAGLAASVWNISDMVRLLEKDEAHAIANGALKRGNYRLKLKTPQLPD